MNKDLNYYLNLPYAIWLVPSDEEDGGWLAKIPDLPGCITFGDTKEEALAMIEDARIAWISHRFEEGYLIPEPVGSPES
ncbi:MAG: type II toxin-antitoxin system HicB family antitoxin [Anaerolineae bacterium]|nr:type II toxin-antitoxin system HicB family antitoxin [Anaerolineae bacterium]